MKFFAVAFTLLLAGTSALPENHVAIATSKAGDERFVVDAINLAIQQLSDMLVEAGLDPYVLPEISYEISSPKEILLTFRIYVKDFSFAGISNIVVNSINFSALTTRLTFDISIPEISFDFGSSGASLDILGLYTIDTFQLGGSIGIIEPRVDGDVRLSIGISSGVSIRSLTVEFDVENVVSNLTVKIWRLNVSSPVNSFISSIIPSVLDRYSDEINALLTEAVQAALESILN